MTNSDIYVYLVRRVMPENEQVLRCTDLVGKVGRGKGDRKNAYRTPYGSSNLQIDVWQCKDKDQSVIFEKFIHDLLDMRGWLAYHSTGNRAEVMSFSFIGNTQINIIKEYMKNMAWIYNLMNYYHMNIDRQEYTNALSLVSHMKSRFSKNTINIDDVASIYGLGQTSTSNTLSTLYRMKMKIKRLGTNCIIVSA